MSLVHTVASAVAERLKDGQVSAWVKASYVAEFQTYLRSMGAPNSTRDLAMHLDVPQTRIAEQLTIASELDATSLARYGVSSEDLADAPHRDLFRTAKLTHYLRDKPLRDLARKHPPLIGNAAPGKPTLRERRRSNIFEKLRDEGQLLIDIPQPMRNLSKPEASTYLDEFLPALAHLMEIVKEKNRTHHIALAGNGGLVIYVHPVN